MMVDKKIDYYVGSVSFDDDEHEFTDHVMWAVNKADLIEKMRAFMQRRRNSEVLFVSSVVSQGGLKYEYDITELTKNEMRKHHGVG